MIPIFSNRSFATYNDKKDERLKKQRGIPVSSCRV
jgi:hypothetical protein